MVDRVMLDRIKSLLESRKRELTMQGSDNHAPGLTAEDHKIAHIQPAARTDNGMVFPVDDVVPAADPLWVGTLRESVEIRTDASVLIMPD